MTGRLLLLGVLLGILVAGSVQAALPDHPAVVERPVPDWVEMVALDVTVPRPEDGNLDVTYLLADTQIRLPAKGGSTAFRQFAYRIESRGALEEWSSWDIELDPSYHRLEMHHLMVFRDGAWEDRLASSRASMLQREDDLDRQIFDQRFNLVWIFDDIQPGDVVSIAYSMVGENPVFDGHLVASESLAWGRTLHQRRLRVSRSSQRALSYKVFGTAAAPEIGQSGEWHSLVWDLSPVEEIDYEIGAPVEHVQYPYVQFSEFRDWQQVVQWALPLYEVTLERTPEELRELASQIAADHPTPEARLVAARNWVQENIRYFGVMLGAHSHAPHESQEILRRHYGDCKDKTILLVELLRLLDIEAYPAFVHSRLGDSIAERLPSPTVFDHAIVLADLGDREVWIDPTLNFQGGDLSLGELCVPDYGLALPVKAGVDGLQAISKSQSDPGRTEVVYTYDLKEEGEPWTVRIETTYERHQAEDMRSLLDSTSASDLLESYVEHYTSETLQVESIAPLGVVDHRDENLLSVTEVYRVTYNALSAEDSTILDALPLLLSGDLAQPEMEEERRSPFALAKHPRRSERILLHLPSDFQLEPVSISEENPWFRFSIASRDLPPNEVGAGRIGMELHYELEHRADQVDVEQLEVYTTSVQTVWDNLGYSIWNEGLMGPALRRFTWLGLAGAGLAVLFLATACLVALARWRLI